MAAEVNSLSQILVKSLKRNMLEREILGLMEDRKPRTLPVICMDLEQKDNHDEVSHVLFNLYNQGYLSVEEKTVTSNGGYITIYRGMGLVPPSSNLL